MYVLIASSKTLLDYQFGTQPSPLTVSPKGGSPVIGAVTVVVSNGTSKPIWLEKLTIGFDISDIAQSLASDGSGIDVSASPGTDWTSTVTSRSSVFTVEITPVDGSPVAMTTEGLVVHIYGIPINHVPGVALVGVTEQASTDGKTFGTGKTALQVGKFPYGFFVGNFTAQTPMVPHGGTATLSWNGADNAQYFITYGSNPPVNVTNLRSYTSLPLTADTVFVLRATVVQQSEAVDYYLSTAVTVAMPDLDATSLAVARTSALGGNVSVGSVATPATLTVNGGAAVSQALSVGSTLSAAQDASIGGALAVTGTTTLGAATVGNLSVASLTVAGAAVLGQLSLTGPSAVIGGQPQGLSPGSYVAGADGFVIGYIGFPDNDATIKSGAWLTTSCNGVTSSATGGNTSAYYWKGDYIMASNPASTFLPVPKGATFTVDVQMFDDIDQDPPVSVWFVPLGQGNAIAGSTYAERIGDAQPADGVGTPTSAALSIPEDGALAVAADAIAQSIPSGLSPDRRTALAAALAGLFRR